MDDNERKAVSLWVSKRKAEYYQKLAVMREQSRSEFLIEMADNQIRLQYSNGTLLKRDYETEGSDE
jgi:hypothetical protein